jgi:RNA 2',3'-cyclic 3'-phosphodiesterase
MSERLFLAVSLDPGSRELLNDEIRALRGAGFEGRIVPAANWHLTLRFLGPSTPDQRELFGRYLRERGLGHSFSVALGGWGAFPSPGRARVVWIGVDDPDGRLNAIASTAENAARRAGFPPEIRPYAPHLTISRLREPADLRTLIAGLPSFDIPLQVDRVVLFRSELGGGTPRYEEVESFPLASHP